MTHDQLAESLAKAIGEDAARKIGLLRAHPDRVAHELDRHAMQRSAKALGSVYALIRSGAPPEAIQQDSGQITARAGGDAQVPDSGAAAQTRTGDLLITNQSELSPQSTQEQTLSEEQARAGAVEKGESVQGRAQTLQQGVTLD